MAKDTLLEGFIQAFPGDLERSLANAFDTLMAQPDEAAANQLKLVMERHLEDRIHAIETD